MMWRKKNERVQGSTPLLRFAKTTWVGKKRGEQNLALERKVQSTVSFRRIAIPFGDRP